MVYSYIGITVSIGFSDILQCVVNIRLLMVCILCFSLAEGIIVGVVLRVCTTHVDVGPQQRLALAVLDAEVNIVETELACLTVSIDAVGIDEGTHPIDGVDRHIHHGLVARALDAVDDSGIIQFLAGHVVIPDGLVVGDADVGAVADDITHLGMFTVIHELDTLDKAVERGLVLVNLPADAVDVDGQRGYLLGLAVEGLVVQSDIGTIPVFLVGTHSVAHGLGQRYGVESVVDVSLLHRVGHHAAGGILKCTALEVVEHKAARDGGVFLLHGFRDT